jgi:hypothetical protein
MPRRSGPETCRRRLEEVIASTQCASLAGAAVKLRRLADPALGIEAGNAQSDIVSLRHVLAVVEVEVLERYAPEYVARVRAGAAEMDEVIGFGAPDER